MRYNATRTGVGGLALKTNGQSFGEGVPPSAVHRTTFVVRQNIGRNNSGEEAALSIGGIPMVTQAIRKTGRL